MCIPRQLPVVARQLGGHTNIEYQRCIRYRRYCSAENSFKRPWLCCVIVACPGHGSCVPCCPLSCRSTCTLRLTATKRTASAQGARCTHTTLSLNIQRHQIATVAAMLQERLFELSKAQALRGMLATRSESRHILVHRNLYEAISGR